MPRGVRTVRTGKKEEPTWIEPFLEQLRKHGTVEAAARAADVGRSTVYDEAGRNEDLKAAIEGIRTGSIEEVEATFYRRARSGASDTAIIFYLKANKPEKYREGVRADEIARIKAEARQELLGELRAEIGALTDPAARRALMAAGPSDAASGAPPVP
jgi:hypothetical protein